MYTILAKRAVVLKWFYSLSRRKTFVGGKCALPNALLVAAAATTTTTTTTATATATTTTTTNVMDYSEFCNLFQGRSQDFYFGGA